MIVDPMSGETPAPKAQEVGGAIAAGFGSFASTTVSELMNQSNLMAIEAALVIAHRGLDHLPHTTLPYTGLIAQARELADAATRATMGLVDSEDRKTVERDALDLGKLALAQFRRPNRPTP